MIYMLTHYYYDDQIEKNEIGGTRSTYDGEERCVHCYGGKTCGKESTWKTQV